MALRDWLAPTLANGLLKEKGQNQSKEVFKKQLVKNSETATLATLATLAVATPTKTAKTLFQHLPLLHEDRLFVDDQLRRLALNGRQKRAVQAGYAQHWEQGAAAIPAEHEHRKNNSGRFAANSWLRELSRDDARALPSHEVLNNPPASGHIEHKDTTAFTGFATAKAAKVAKVG